MKPISFIQPSRSNLKYLKWSYNSIRKNLGYIHEICWADDFSDDGTGEVLKDFENDKEIQIFSHETNLGKGAAIISAKKFVKGDVVIIQDADLEYDPRDYIKILKAISKENEILYHFCKKKLNIKHYDFFVFGHRHLPLKIELDNNSYYYNTGDWINHYSFLHFKDDSLELKYFKN